MDDERQGGCQCGKLRYAISGSPVAIAACHCTQCQCQSGSAFSMSLVMPREGFRWLSGEPRIYSTKADSGTDKLCGFCPDCGVRITNELGAMPKTINVKPGTLDDTSWLAPNLHVWLGSKQPWVPIPDGVPTFDANPRR